jgi:predicted TIM-barrel fold metal-dependent hydrolase
MRMEDMILISVDDHVVEPPDMFKGRVPSKYLGMEPVLKQIDNGQGGYFDAWTYEGNVIPNIGLNAVAGRPPEEYNFNPTRFDEIRAGCYDIDERVKDMDRNGVLASACFPSFPQFCGQLFSRSKDKDLGLAMVQAYNDWHIEGWCGAAPGRFIPLAIPPIWDAELMAAEVRRNAARGCHNVTFSEDPSKLGWPSLHDESWDPFYAACVETDTQICVHIGSSSTMVELNDAPIDVMITLTPMNSFQAASNIIWSPALKRFPDLKFALSEGGIGWIPYFLERIDYVYERHRFWTNQQFGDMLPSQKALEVFSFCFIDDKVGVHDRDLVGIDNISWECDYPHSDSSWPQSPEALVKHFDGVSDEDINKITHLNAMRRFHVDPFTVIPREQATVGALRARAS